MTPSYATLDWTDDGQPLSQQHGDVYFSRANGLDETRHVFLTSNALPARWAGRDAFTIAETGFGTGLNFLAAWQLWQQHRPTSGQLHFISLEKYPLSQEDLRRALDLWPELAPLTNQLLATYPQLLETGQARFDTVHLTLHLGDAREILPAWQTPVDAWFLDGFAPAKNPDMWDTPLFDAMARLSHTGTTFATFTAAGIVKRGAQSAGFDVRKIRGFGHKRDMLVGHKP